MTRTIFSENFPKPISFNPKFFTVFNFYFTPYVFRSS